MQAETTPPTLAEALNFTPEDLAANRNGTLSEAQLSRLRTNAGCRTAGGMVLTLGLAGVGFWMVNQSWWWGALVFFAMAGGLFALSRLGRGTFTEELNSATVSAVTGEVVLSTSDYSSPNRKVTEYVLEIGEEAFVLSREAFAAFEDGDTYTVYFLPKLRVVLSAEGVG